jgi:hypothetical protein
MDLWIPLLLIVDKTKIYVVLLASNYQNIFGLTSTKRLLLS